MTKLYIAAWGLAIVANIQAVAGNRDVAIATSVVALVCILADYAVNRHCDKN